MSAMRAQREERRSVINGMHLGPVLIQVEILEARGLDSIPDDKPPDAPESFGEHLVYEAEMRLVNGYTGDALEDAGMARSVLAEDRRKTFMSRRHAADRFIFAAASRKAAVRFDVYRRYSRRPASPAEQDYSQFIGAAEVIATTEERAQHDDPHETPSSGYVRWIRLLHDVRLLHGRDSLVLSERGSLLFGGTRKRQAAAKGEQPHNADASHLDGPALRVMATMRVSTGSPRTDAVLAADSVERWFYGPALDAPNVVRIGVVRIAGGSVSVRNKAVVAAKLVSERHTATALEDASPFFESGTSADSLVAKTRLSSTAVWLETLTLPIPHGQTLVSSDGDGDSWCVDVAVLDVVVAPNGRKSSERLFGRALIPIDHIDTDELCWVELSPGISLKLALKLDYDETLDPNDTRPYFDQERFASLNNDRYELKEPPLGGTNVLRVVAARAVGLTGAHYCTATVHLDSLGLKSPLPVMERSTFAAPVRRDGTVVWNDCLELTYPEQRASPESIRLTLSARGSEIGVVERNIWVDAPRNRIARRWYDLPGLPRANAQVLIVAMQCRQAGSDWFLRSRAATAALSFAYPEVDMGSIERVLESTQGDMKHASIALGTMAWHAAGNYKHRVEYVEYEESNATDLSWALEQDRDELSTIDEQAEYFEVPEETLREDQMDGEEGTDMFEEPGSSTDDLPSLCHESMTTTVLTKREAVELMKLQPVNTLQVAMKLEASSPTLAPDDGEYSLHEDHLVDEDDQFGPGEKRALLVKLQKSLQSATSRRPKIVRRRERTMLRVRTSFSNLQQRPNSVAKKFETTPFELTRVDVEVARKPRDFVTLKYGLTTKLGTDEIPELPNWIRRSLMLKRRTRTTSLAVGFTAASLAGSVAAVTGVVPALAITGGFCFGAVACAGTFQSTKLARHRVIERNVTRCTWLADVVEAVANSTAPKDRKEEAALFLKQFLAHNGRCLMYQGPKPKRAPRLSSLKSSDTPLSMLADHPLSMDFALHSHHYRPEQIDF